ncbi:MAG: glutamine amidotransferase [Gammaproteobacteria bacterium]|nr:glutamine amidotransferase [Gammaproteobacteria bacterium]
MKSATVIRHLPFEGLGSFADPLAAQGYTIRYLEAGLDDLAATDPLANDLLVVLGGPIGVHQQTDYPYLGDELDIVRSRIAAGRPTLGICLGAQILACALGAKVATAPAPEIGWSILELTDEGRHSPLRHLEGVPVLHWHGDRFELPAGAERLAATPPCPNQAFRLSSNLLGLQCHPEVRWPELETWLIGHVRGLKTAGISVRALREASRRHAPVLVSAARRLLTDWLAGIKT